LFFSIGLYFGDLSVLNVVVMEQEAFFEEAFFTGRNIGRAVQWCKDREGNVIEVRVQGVWRESGEHFRGKGRLLEAYSGFLSSYIAVLLESGKRGGDWVRKGSVVTVGGPRSKCDVQALNLVFRNYLKRDTSQMEFFDANHFASALRWLRRNILLRRVVGKVEGVWSRSGANFMGEGEVIAVEGGVRGFFVLELKRGRVGGEELEEGSLVSIGSNPLVINHLASFLKGSASSLNLVLKRGAEALRFIALKTGGSSILESRGATILRSSVTKLSNYLSSLRGSFPLARSVGRPDVVVSKMLFKPKQARAKLVDGYVLKVRGLTVSYGKNVVLRNVTFSLREGEILGIVGESGSGKTTCMKALIGELTPDAGEVTICGFPPSDKDSVAPLIGYVPQDLSRMYDNFTPMENIVYFGRQYGIPEDELIKRGKRILKDLEIFTKGNEKVSSLSGGEKRRVSIAIALVHYPRILFLDEPTSGLDLVRRHELWSYLEKINRTYGTTLVVITHYPSEADYCDKVAVFMKNKGFIDFGTPKELVAKLPGSGYAIGLILEEDEPEAEELIKSTEGVSYVFRIGPYYKVLVGVEDGGAVLRKILSRLSSRGIKVYKVEPRVEVNFEDYFRYLTGTGKET